MHARHPLRRARWIWPTFGQDVRNTYAHFRRDFSLARVPRSAPFFITADQAYMLYVNGHYVSRGPARGYQDSWPYDEVDLAPFLVAGHNWIAVRGYNAGISTFQYLHQTAAGLLCAGAWGATEILSGPGWLMREDPSHRLDTARLSIQLNFQEHVDARLDDQGWVRSAPAPKDGWCDAGAGVPFGYPPWHGLEPRGIPNLGNDVLPYERVASTGAGPCDPDYAAWENPTYGFHGELPALAWTPGGKATLPATKGLAAAAFDLGQLGIGTLLVDASGAEGGEVVDFFFTEGLNEDGSPILGPPGSACRAAMTARLTLRPGRTRHEFFQMMGHRYVVAIARQTRKPVRLRLALRHTAYPLKVRGRLATDDPVTNAIHAICVRTQQVCALDSYVDTPWREQAQWWGDARVQAQNTFHLAGDTRLLARGIRSIARQEVPNGLTYGHAPTIAHNCVLPDFSLIWALTIWDAYWQTGDPALFVEQWPRIQRLLRYFTGEGVGPKGLLQYDQRYWLFLDWTDLHKAGVPTLLNLWHLLTLEKLAEMARAADMPLEATFLADMRDDQERRILRHLFDRKAGLFHDGLTWSGKPVRVHSVHTQTLAILCGLKPERHGAMVRKRLLPLVRGKAVPGGQPSSYWITYVYDVLRRLGHGREVFEHIRERWAPMVPWGGCWETFGGNIGGGTCSHAWAAHPIYHLAGTLGGVSQTGVGWSRIAFAPVVDAPAVGKADLAIPTPHGLIRSAWKRGGDAVAVTLTLPKGVEADVRLPGTEGTVGPGRHAWQV